MGKMAKILIVDDAAFMRKVIRDMLAKNGYDDVTEAVDGKDAVEKYFEIKPNLVLMDITMPNMDVIVKPFKEDRLMKAVNTILGNG